MHMAGSNSSGVDKAAAIIPRVDETEIRAKLTALLLEIVGASVGPDEPFMEVGLPSVHVTTFPSTSCFS